MSKEDVFAIWVVGIIAVAAAVIGIAYFVYAYDVQAVKLCTELARQGGDAVLKVKQCVGSRR